MNEDEDCEHPDFWFSREICWCGDMHYYCTECGAQIDEHGGERDD